MNENQKHFRVPLQNIQESPANGVYLTKEELRKYGVFAGLILAILTFFAVFDRNR